MENGDLCPICENNIVLENFCNDCNLVFCSDCLREKIIEVEPENKTIRISLDDIPAHIYRGLDFNEIRKIEFMVIC